MKTFKLHQLAWGLGLALVSPALGQQMVGGRGGAYVGGGFVTSGGGGRSVAAFRDTAPRVAPAAFRTAPQMAVGRSYPAYRATNPAYRAAVRQSHPGYRVAGRSYYGVNPAPVGAIGLQQRADYRYNRTSSGTYSRTYANRYPTRYPTRYAWDRRRQWERNDWRRNYRDNRGRIVVSTSVRGPYYWPGYSYYSPYYYSPYYYVRDYPSSYPVVSAAYDYADPYGYYDTGYTYTSAQPAYYGSVVVTSGPIAARVQRELALSGYYRGRIDGVVGPRTRAAIAAFQRDHRLPVTARVDLLLLRTLGMV